MSAKKTLNDLTSMELWEIIIYITDAYNNHSVTRSQMIAELKTTYELSSKTADKIQDAVIQAEIRRGQYKESRTNE